MILHLPWPPSVNHYWERNRNGGMRVGAKGVAYRREVWATLRGLQGYGQARMKVAIELYPPDKRRRDIDNPLKCLLDSLSHAGAYTDDEQIDDLHIVRGPVSKGGYVRVRIDPILEAT